MTRTARFFRQMTEAIRLIRVQSARILVLHDVGLFQQNPACQYGYSQDGSQEAKPEDQCPTHMDNFTRKLNAQER